MKYIARIDPHKKVTMPNPSVHLTGYGEFVWTGFVSINFIKFFIPVGTTRQQVT